MNRKEAQTDLYIGLMSGTSMDAMDGVLVAFTDDARPELMGSVHVLIEPELKASLTAVNYSGTDELNKMAEADIAVAELSAKVVNQLLCKYQLRPEQINAIGSHGQTIRHWPALSNTLQIGSPSHIAEATGITTIADFRRRDMAAGGQGAPLAPAFHSSVFSLNNIPRVIINIGGISNITNLPGNTSSPVTGFDTGPGNVLLDYWTNHHRNKPYDRDGQWASTGSVNTAFLEALMSDEYFNRQPPKSTGRDHFNPDWLEKHLTDYRGLSAQDVQATITELTSRTISQAIRHFSYNCKEIYVCGGGALNLFLMSRLQLQLPEIPVRSTSILGISPLHVEAMAFAWLAHQTLNHRPGNIHSVTAAEGPRILGGIYPA